MGNESAQMMPLLSVIIPTFNSIKAIKDLLDSLRTQSYPNHSLEIIVVDDGSEDGTYDFVTREFPEVQILCQKNLGSYAARNRGIQCAKGEILAFTDADCVPAPSWLSNAVETLCKKDIDILVGAIEFLFINPNSVVELYDFNFHLNQNYFAHSCKFGATANIVVRRSVIERFGNFDSNLRSGGDLKFCRTAVAKGANLLYDKNSIVFHPTRRTIRQLLKKRIRVSRGLWPYSKPILRKLRYSVPIPLLNYPAGLQRVNLKNLHIFARLRFLTLHYIIELARSIDCLLLLVIDIVNPIFSFKPKSQSTNN